MKSLTYFFYSFFSLKRLRYLSQCLSVPVVRLRRLYSMSQRMVVGNAGMPSVPNTHVAMREVEDRAFAPEAVAPAPAREPVRQHAPLAVDTASANARAAEAHGDSGRQDPHDDQTRRVWGGWSSPASAAADQSGGGTGGRNRNVGSPPAIDGGAAPQALERQSSRAASRGKIAGVGPRVGMEADITFQQRIPPPPDDQPPHMNQSLIIRIRLDGFGGGRVVLPPPRRFVKRGGVGAVRASPSLLVPNLGG